MQPNSSQPSKDGGHRARLRRRHAGHQRSRLLAGRGGDRRRSTVFPIPGANAALSALIASGLPTERISVFRIPAGEIRRPPHPPRGTSRATSRFRRRPLSSMKLLIASPIRSPILRPFSVRLSASWPPANSPTPRRFLRGTVADVRQHLAARDRIRGEFVLLIEAPAKKTVPQAGSSDRGRRFPPKLTVSNRNRTSTKRKPLSAWRASWASPNEVYRELQRGARPSQIAARSAHALHLPHPFACEALMRQIFALLCVCSSFSSLLLRSLTLLQSTPMLQGAIRPGGD